MKNRIIGGLIALTLLAGAAGAWAQAQKQEAKAMPAKAQMTERTGMIQVLKADPSKHEKYDTVLLMERAGAEPIKLLPGKDKKAFKPLEKLDGKIVVVKGEYLEPNPPKYPMAAIKVVSVTESKGAPAAAKK